jgi:pimeloyl-ACP methyl ester carboxylesterase
MKTIHSLIVAIDEYPIPAHRLNGCKNDATAFSEYLGKYAKANGFKYSENRLFDANAKRLSVVEGFKNLKKAADKDVCVLYYSGHGSQMPAPPEFWDEQDRMSETLVCWDSRTPGGRDLIDKELATLIWSVTNEKDVHFLAVMDCCHSGSNTRDMSVKARMAEPSTFVPRDVKGFFGNEVWDNFQPPTSRHVHLAAAKDNETAKELKINELPRGAFTHTLIKMLEQTGGNITYNELTTRVSQNVKNIVQEQSPQCDAFEETADTDLTFLGAGTKKGEFLISHDDTEGWIVNVGAVQGVSPSGANFVLKDGREISINTVKTNYSTVNGDALTNTDEQYPVTLKNVEAGLLKLPVLRIAFSKDSDKAGIDILKERLTSVPSKTIQIVDNEADTDYVIRAYDNSYRLCKRGDTVPLFKREAGYNVSTAQRFLKNIETISKWRAKLELDNALTTIADSEFEIKVLDIANNPMPRPYILKQVDDATAFRVQVGVKNVGSRNYWVSALYIGSDFSVSNQFMPKKEIKPGETAWIEYNNKPSVPFNIQAEYRSWGVNEIQEYFKIFISTDPIDTSIHNQKGLELDVNKGAERSVGEAIPEVPMNDWRTILLPLTVICPLKSRDVVGGNPVQMFDAEITAPQGFSAKMNLASTMQATAQASRSVKKEPILRGGMDMSPAAFAEGLSNSPPLDVLEINNAVGTVSFDNPLKIKLKNIKENELVLPFGFDAATGLYLPLGFSDETGTINVNHLPEAEKGEVSRSLGGSAMNALKIYFKKLVKPIFGNYDYPLLRMAKFTDNVEEMTYETDKAVIQKAVSEANSILLFVHGLIGATDSNAKALTRAAQAAGEEGVIGGYDLVLTLDYESLNTTIETTASDLEKRLKEVGITEGVGKRFDIMAHSMGCLVSRHFVERLSGSKIVKTLYLFGAPNNGSTLAELKNMIGTGITLAVNGLSFLQPYILPLSFLGKGLGTMLVTIGELDPKSAFITDLNNAPDTGIRYYATAGNVELMKQTQPEQHGFYQKVMESLKKAPDNMINSLFGEPHDMAVPVRSVRSVGKQTNVEFREIACDHFNFFEVNSVGLTAMIEEVKGEEHAIM